MLNISKFPFVSYPFKQIHTLNTEKEVKQRESKRVKIHNFNLDWTRNVVPYIIGHICLILAYHGMKREDKPGTTTVSKR